MQEHDPGRTSPPAARTAQTSAPGFRLSPHAARRQRQRGVPPAAIDAALRWGRLERQADGRTAYHLGRRAVRLARASGAELSEFENVGVLMAADGVVVTVFRSPDTRRLRRRRR